MRLPLLLIGLSVAYGVLYVMYNADHTSLFYYLAGDMTVALCLLFAGTLESCLLAGLIPTNTGYDTLFGASLMGMQIVDRDYCVCYASNMASTFTKEEMKRAEEGEYLVGADMLLKAWPLRGGHIVWQEDVSELAQVKRKLESTREELQDRNALLRDQYRQDAQRYRLEEQNRLYDLAQRETQKQLWEIDALAADFGRLPPDAPARRAVLLRILVLATYIKRHKDMVVSADRSSALPVGLLEGGAARIVWQSPACRNRRKPVCAADRPAAVGRGGAGGL